MNRDDKIKFLNQHDYPVSIAEDNRILMGIVYREANGETGTEWTDVTDFTFKQLRDHMGY